MSEPIRVAVIGRTGKGNYGHGLDVVWKDIEGVHVVAVADEDATGLAKAAERLGVEAAYRDYRRMLAEERPQVVSVAPRWIDCHRDMALACAESGAHVFLEKPFCRDLAEADELVDAFERRHLKLAIAHQSRYSPRIERARELLAEGRIGEVVEYRGRGKEDRRGGGEDLWVLGTHVFDLMRLLGGDARWCFARVTQGGRPIRKEDVREGNEGIGPLAGDGIDAMFGLESGATAYFASHRERGGSPTRFGLTVCGTKGQLELHTGFLPPVKLLEDPSWSPGQTGSRWQDVTSAGLGAPEPLTDGGLHAGNVLVARDLIATLDVERQPRGSIYDARAATEMIAAVFESQRQGRPVELPLENRRNPLTML